MPISILIKPGHFWQVCRQEYTLYTSLFHLRSVSVKQDGPLDVPLSVIVPQTQVMFL